MEILKNRYVLSSITTFLSVFLLTVGMQLSQGVIEWTTTFWFAVLMIGSRAALKAVVEGLAGRNAD